VDPWPQLRFKQHALALIDALTARDPGPARRLFVALREPFSVRATDTARLMTRVDLATRVDFEGTCRDAIDELEPHVPWTGRFLVLRRDCYQATADPRLGAALRDLGEFASGEPLPLAPP
jgi:hypothetical protein